MSTKANKPAKPEDVKKDVIIDMSTLAASQPSDQTLQNINNMIDAVAQNKKKRGPRKGANGAAKPDATKPDAPKPEDTKSVAGSETPSQIERKKRSTNLVAINDSENRGIILPPNKIRKIMKRQYIDPVNNEVLRRLDLAANNKDEKGNSAPIEIKRLQSDIIRVIQQAETEYMLDFMREYERKVIKKYDAAKQDDYNAKKTVEMSKYHETHKLGKYHELDMKQESFDLEKFNRSYDPHFYDGFEAYYNQEDKYVVGKTNVRKNGRNGSDIKKVVTEHYRASVLIRRRMKRLNVGVATIVASFLDYLIMALHTECINAAFSEPNHNTYITLNHVISCSSADKPSPILRFISTFDNYANAVRYIKNLKTSDNSRRTTLVYEKPASYSTDFAKKVGDLCAVVRRKLTGSRVTEAENHAHNCKMAASYKMFLGCIVYEAISRISNLLLEEINSKDVRTINHEHAWLVLRQIHNVCNIPFDTARQVMKESLIKNSEWVKSVRRANTASKFSSHGKPDKMETVVEDLGSSVAEHIAEEDLEETDDEDNGYEVEA